MKRKGNGQFNGSESLNLGKTHVPTAGRRLALAGAGLAATTLVLTGCGPAKVSVATPKLVCYTSTPPAGFQFASNAARLAVSKVKFPKISGPAATAFGKAEAQAAFEAGFLTIHNLNILGKLWVPNLNKDPKFIPTLEAELRSYSPYFCGAIKTKFIEMIPSMVNPTTTTTDSKGKIVVKDKEGIATWRGMLGLPARLTDGTLPPPSTNVNDLELVAPFSLGQKILGVPIVNIEKDPSYKIFGPVISFQFDWQSALVYGTKTAIEWEQPLTRNVTIVMAKNPDAISAKDFPYVMVDFGSKANTLKSSFGKMIKHHAPLVEAPPA